jgi:hypothetical protein
MADRHAFIISAQDLKPEVHILAANKGVKYLEKIKDRLFYFKNSLSFCNNEALHLS